MKLTNLKYFFFGLALIVIGLFASPNFSFAFSKEEVIQSLMNQIKLLQAQLVQLQNSPNTSLEWCYTFDKNLKFDNKGKEIIALHQALEKEGFGPFDRGGDDFNAFEVFAEQTASAVVGFQQKYKDDILTPNGLKYGTGFVGKFTRAKLNQLYGCGASTRPVTDNGSGHSITVLSPNGGETWTKGTTQTIKWQDNTPQILIYPVPTRYYDIKLVSYYPPCTGQTGQICPEYYPIANGISGNSYQWNVGKIINTYGGGEVAPDGSYTIQVCQSGTGTPCDSSNSYFKISSSSGSNHAPEIVTSSSNEGAIQPGQTVNMGWTARDADNDDLSWGIEWGDGQGQGSGTVCTQSGKGWAFNASHSWANVGVYKVKVIVSDCVGGSDSYSSTVTVGNVITPSITVLSPNGGEQWEVGKSYPIKWETSGWPTGRPTDGIVSISLFPMFGGDHAILLTPNDGIEYWTVPSEGINPGDNFFIKINCPSELGNVKGCPPGPWPITEGVIYDQSDAPFSIVGSSSSSSSDPTNAPSITSVAGMAAGNNEIDAGGSVGIQGINLAGYYKDNTKVYIDNKECVIKQISDTLIYCTAPLNLIVGNSYDLYLKNDKGLSNTVKVKVLSIISQSSSSAVSSIIVTGPSSGSIFDKGESQNIIASWQGYTGDFDHYYVSVGNTIVYIEKRISGAISRFSNGYSATVGAIKEIVSNNTPGVAPDGGYYYRVEAIKADTGGERRVGGGKSGIFSIVSNVAMPSITLVSPGSASVGATVTIYGYNFNTTANNDVLFKNTSTGATAIFYAISSNGTTLTFTIPNATAAGSYNIVVDNNVHVATSQAYPFTVTSSDPINAPSMTISLDSSSPLSKTITPGLTDVVFATVRFAATNGDIAFGQISIGSENPDALSNIKIYDGSTLLGIVPALTNSDTFRLGLKWSSINITPLTVPNNTHKIITIKSNINTSASGSVRLGVVGLGDFKPWPLKTNWPSSYGVFGPYMTIATATTTPSSPADPTTSQGSSSSSSPSDPTTSSQSLNQSAQTANTLESMRQILNQMLESLKNKQKEDFI
ncbi:MAG: hypothetical protein A2Z62_00400 [Candidatus Terrybacteria bacterium RIFCSPLOWO2_02_42_20]|uniref:PKD domain-containing protein n=1 Tax=Candidatus Terrybacteria bacterium RIFCSPLOWO2_02_42_20 TaxID=1802370 RepID=A0A1G2Q273_9BACT|nr:MAG: hypothetical protein A2Z62_00400 [Candidatus Terrybacteria bacterium RIFCSPLOWO2_02_42_20]